MNQVERMKHRLLQNPRIKMVAFNFPRGTGLTASLSDILEEQPGQKYFLSEKMAKGLLDHAKDRGKKSHIILGPTKPEDMETQT